MGIHERLKSIYSFSKKHKKEIAVLGALSVAATSCIEIPNREASLTPVPILQNSDKTSDTNKTATLSPKPVYGSEELVRAGCPNKTIGIRNDYPEIMDDPGKLCLGAVRIQVDPYTFYKSPKTEQAIKKAKELGYSVLCTLVTHGPTKDEVELAIRIAGECDVEQIGNEVDNKVIPFWEESEKYKKFKSLSADKNTLNEIILDEFTDHFINIYQEIRKVNPKIQIILGANVDVGLTVRTFQILSEKSVSMNDVYIAAHVYNTSDDVRQRMGFLAQHFNTSKIVATEVGAINDNKKVLVNMLETIRQIDERIDIFIHELSDEEKGFGCRDINEPELDEKCLPIREFALNDLREHPKHRLPPQNRATETIKNQNP